MFDEEEDLDPELLAEISNLGEISEAEIEAERLRIVASDSQGLDLLDLDDDEGKSTSSIAIDGNSYDH